MTVDGRDLAGDDVDVFDDVFDDDDGESHDDHELTDAELFGEDTVADDDIDAESSDATAEIPPQVEKEPRRRVFDRQHVVGSVLFARIATALLWLLIVGAVLLAVVALATRMPPPSSAGDVGSDVTVAGDDAVLVAGFAQMAVRRYVGEAGQDTEDVMDGLVADGVSELTGVTPRGFYVVDAVTVDVDALGGGQWSATVACELMAAVEGKYEPIGVRYYSVGVTTGDGDGSVVLTDLPSMVPVPDTVDVPEPAAPLGLPLRGDPKVTAAREFLGALLLGEGSIQRYTAPGTEIEPITPPPFATLEVDRMGIADPEADETPVRVSVLVVDDRGLAQRLNYTLNMRVREGRWEVTELLGAPPIEGENET